MWLLHAKTPVWDENYLFSTRERAEALWMDAQRIGVASHVVYLYNGLIEEKGPPEQLFGAQRATPLGPASHVCQTLP